MTLTLRKENLESTCSHHGAKTEKKDSAYV